MSALAARAPLAAAVPPGWVEPPRFRKNTRYPDSDVRRVREVIRFSALVPFFEDRLRKRTGRRLEGMTIEAMLVAMLCAASDRRAMHFTEISEVLHHRLSDRMRDELGVTRPRPPVVPADAPRPVKDEALAANEAAVKQVRDLFHRMLAPIDPSPNPKNAVLDPTAFAQRTKARAERLPPEERGRRQALLDWTANRLLEATWLTLPRSVRKAWKGSLVQDATYLKCWAQPNKKNPDGTLRWISCDADAGWYIRTGDHYSDGTQGHDKIKYGYEAELAILGADSPDDLQAFPKLVMGLTVKAPGLDPAGHALAVLGDISRRHELFDPATGAAFPDGTHPDGPAPDPHPIGWLAVDRAYSNTDAQDWALPVRALGYRPVIDYRADQLGLQGSHLGMLLVEGRWYSPSMPTALIDASKDHKIVRKDGTRKIDEALYRRRIAERRHYEIRLGPANADGDRRASCQAASTPSGSLRSLVKCAQEPGSLVPQKRFDGRPVMPLLVTTAGAVPKICQATTVTIHAGVHAKHQQDLVYESPEWNGVYHSLRNSIEGENAHAKDTATYGVEEAKRRRVRGVAATTLLTAFMIAAENLRKIAAFYDRADWSPDGSMTITRPTKQRARRRVHTTLGEHRPRPPRFRVADPADGTARGRRTHDPAAPPPGSLNDPPDTPADPVDEPRRRAARKRRDTA